MFKPGDEVTLRGAADSYSPWEGETLTVVRPEGNWTVVSRNGLELSFLTDYLVLANKHKTINRCECGSTAAGFTSHSHWCPEAQNV
jgi:hypothetical protein